MSAFGEIHIVPNPYVPENTIIVGPIMFEQLTGTKYEVAVREFGDALVQNVQAQKSKEATP